jgi:hypothetical protein
MGVEATPHNMCVPLRPVRSQASNLFQALRTAELLAVYAPWCALVLALQHAVQAPLLRHAECQAAMPAGGSAALVQTKPL